MDGLLHAVVLARPAADALVRDGIAHGADGFFTVGKAEPSDPLAFIEVEDLSLALRDAEECNDIKLFSVHQLGVRVELEELVPDLASRLLLHPCRETERIALVDQCVHHQMI